MRAVKFDGSLIFTSALRDIENHLAIVDYLFAKVIYGIEFIFTYKRIANDGCTCTAIR